ncbi:MAG TPA: glycosyltransferase family 39 protein [Chloroflexota bacterium]|nr:glycosyltransferase family 39 protein [Chloroflexota bacterium]
MKYRLGLAGIVLLALVFRLWGLGWGLYNATVSRRPHPDEWVVYWLDRWFSHNHNLNPCPHPGAHPAAQCFFDWGSVYPDLGYLVRQLTDPLLAIVPSTAFGHSADPAFVHAVIAGRVTSVIFSTLTVVSVYLFASRAYSLLAGLLAAGATAISGLLIQLAHFATPDSTTTFLVTLTLLMALLASGESSQRLWVAGVTGGLALGTEYHMVLLSIPIAVAWLLAERRVFSHLVTAAGAFVAAAVITNIYALLNWQAWIDAMVHTLDTRTVDSGETYQGRFAPYGPAYLYVIRYPLGYGVGFALTAWYLAGVVFGFVRRRKPEIILLSWLVPYFILVSISSAKFMRYSAPLIPGLAILSGALLASLLQSGQSRVRIGAIVLATAAVLWTGSYDGAYVGLFASTDTRLAETTWLKHHVPLHSQVAFEMLPNGLFNLPYFVSSAGYQPCVTEFRSADLAGPMRYVVTDEYSLEDHHLFSNARVLRFKSALAADPRYTLIHEVHYVPTLFGLTFPIDGSPHDWRYPAHLIETYRSNARVRSAATPCFATLAAAIHALYVPPEPIG